MNHESGPLLHVLTEHGIPAGWTYRVKDMLENPHFQARESIIRLNHPVFGDFPMQNVFPRLSDTPGTVRSLCPKLGAQRRRLPRSAGPRRGRDRFPCGQRGHQLLAPEKVWAESLVVSGFRELRIPRLGAVL